MSAADNDRKQYVETAHNSAFININIIITQKSTSEAKLMTPYVSNVEVRKASLFPHFGK